MALAVDSEMPTNVGFGVDTPGAPSSPQTFSFTNTAGTVLYVCVGLGIGSAGTMTITAVTYGGAAMTNVAQTSTGGGATGGQIAWYRLLSPATGSNTVSISFTFSGTPDEIMAGCISFTGNDTSTPEKQTGINHGSSSTAAITLAGVVAGNITIVGAGAGSSMSAQTQTLSWSNNASGATAMGNHRGSRSASSGSVTHSFTISASDSWATTGVEVAAAGGGSTKAIAPAAITATSAMSGAVQKLAAVKPAAITSTSAVSGTVTKLGTKAIVPAAITSTSTVSGVVVKLAAVRQAAITSTSFLSGAVGGGTGSTHRHLAPSLALTVALGIAPKIAGRAFT